MTGETQNSSLRKARLIEIGFDRKNGAETIAGGKDIAVQFNPQSLKLAYSNETKSAGQPQGSASQYVGKSATKLSVELLFDTSQTGRDVRSQGSGKTASTPDEAPGATLDVAYFIKPDRKASSQKGKQQKRVPPGCRFQWGTFVFDGVMDSLQETLDFFSEDGVPLRSTLSIGISGFDDFLEQPKQPGAGVPGTARQTQTSADRSVPQTVGANGDSSNWKAIAAANNIDDPLHPPAGMALDLNAGASASVGLRAGVAVDLGFSAGLGAGLGFPAGLSGGAGTVAGIGVGASAGFGVGAGASAGVGASPGLAVTAVNSAALSVGSVAGGRANAAGSAGGNFDVRASASGTARGAIATG